MTGKGCGSKCRVCDTKAHALEHLAILSNTCESSPPTRLANEHQKETFFFSLKETTQPIDRKLAEQQVHTEWAAYRTGVFPTS